MLFVEKYSPKTLDELMMDENVKTCIRHLIALDSLNMLIVGNAASGKTTLIKMILNEYYGKSPSSQNSSSSRDNVLYINSAKEQGINYCRTEVKTFCETFSTIPHKKKIVIVDDINQLSDQIQQIFRFYMDHYKSNVHFICSCTSMQKVIENLQSRLTILHKHSFHKDQLREILHHVVEQEHLTMEPSAEEFVLQMCNGTIKILMNYLQLFFLANKPITFALARELCSNINFGLFEQYTQLLQQKQLLPAIQIFLQLFESGYSCIDIINNYYTFVIYTPLLTETQKYEIIPIICKYIVIFNTVHEEEIELACFTNNVYMLLKE